MITLKAASVLPVHEPPTTPRKFTLLKGDLQDTLSSFKTILIGGIEFESYRLSWLDNITKARARQILDSCFAYLLFIWRAATTNPANAWYQTVSEDHATHIFWYGLEPQSASLALPATMVKWSQELN